mmetsp:Transcript_9762/g.23306  ORF Transcript_9762/g.23306 Transcript_9762/m.23306 type:complete len:239 (+) Transcript_9762:1127-1843(+)
MACSGAGAGQERHNTCGQTAARISFHLPRCTRPSPVVPTKEVTKIDTVFDSSVLAIDSHPSAPIWSNTSPSLCGRLRILRILVCDTQPIACRLPRRGQRQTLTEALLPLCDSPSLLLRSRCFLCTHGRLKLFGVLLQAVSLLLGSGRPLLKLCFRFATRPRSFSAAAASSALMGDSNSLVSSFRSSVFCLLTVRRRVTSCACRDCCSSLVRRAIVSWPSFGKPSLAHLGHKSLAAQRS